MVRNNAPSGREVLHPTGGQSRSPTTGDPGVCSVVRTIRPLPTAPGWWLVAAVLAFAALCAAFDFAEQVRDLAAGRVRGE
jgi:hypothetical protein